MNKILLSICLAMLLAFTYAQDCKHARVLGATWATKDVTAQVAHSYNLGTKSWSADAATFGDVYQGNTRTFTVVYEVCQNIATLVVKEGEKITLP